MKAEQQIHTSVAALVGLGMPFERVASAPWINDVEVRLGFSLPESLRVLVSNYRFPQIELGGVEFFANLGDGSDEDIGIAPIRDKGLFDWLRAHRKIHFARSTTGSYDPICLESRRGHSSPVEQIDHEDILLIRKKVRSTILSSSLEELLQRAAA
jgi:hypothetical protein